MLTREALLEASRKGLLSEAQVAPLFEFLTASDVVSDPEEMHFAKGFHDIFVFLGIGILFAGYFIGISFLVDRTAAGPIGMYLGGAGMSWLLAEWFTRKLRLSLPSIVLTGGFLVSTLLGMGSLVGFLFEGDANNWWDIAAGSPLSGNSLMIAIVALPFAVTLLAGWLFYKRFAVPITPAFMSIIGAAFCLLLLSIINESLLSDLLNIWLFLIGVACFALALFFDRKDPLRKGLDSDKAFWLHLVAAPLIVHSVLSIFAFNEDSAVAAVITIALVVFIALVALVIDRRALLASAIGYLGIAIGVLLDKTDLVDASAISLTLLLLGAFVLMLGSGWKSLRRLLLRPFASHPFMHKLPPVFLER